MPPWHVQENKWRAARYGLDAVIILDEDSNERLVTEDLDELLNRLEPVAKSLNCSDELALVSEISRNGGSYQRQRRVAEENNGDLRAVVDALIAELDI
jgi:carboxylate-amine ligase